MAEVDQGGNGWNLFGFQIKKKDVLQPQSFVPVAADDGSAQISTSTGAAYNSYVIDLDPASPVFHQLPRFQPFGSSVSEGTHRIASMGSVPSGTGSSRGSP